ncbi:DUF302 domain-containing protein [Promethearchaeum syntrophicum]|uniref:DUF302 domain-containing protein n=1 Tax=Promethearchaeum syntrophicum TaxID=2594042 RepID=A0A5B9DF04_9ARCH|nr:DUF302 domain-containing protein [Candidatus Prometheoarchaeum syntrophicum]QEE17370.1 hypothetical protein DSAG12_03203 [Candidatus Prometheoarchaeum syntrophicum]
MVDILKKELKMDFDSAVTRVEKIVSEEGFTVMLTKPIDEIFKKKLGLKEYPKYTTILACGAKFAKAAMDVSKDVGLLFPCSFVVYEEGNKIYVSHSSIMKIAPEIGFASYEEMKPVIEMTGKAVHTAWDRL